MLKKIGTCMFDARFTSCRFLVSASVNLVKCSSFKSIGASDAACRWTRVHRYFKRPRSLTKLTRPSCLLLYRTSNHFWWPFNSHLCNRPICLAGTLFFSAHLFAGAAPVKDFNLPSCVRIKMRLVTHIKPGRNIQTIWTRTSTKHLWCILLIEICK